MNALIIAAHGSRNKKSNLEVDSLTQRVSDKIKKKFTIIDHAFLQFAKPLLENKLDEIVKKGVKSVVIFPLFIGSGNHILVDIPEVVQKCQIKYEPVEFKITRHLGKIQTIEDVIVNEVIK